MADTDLMEELHVQAGLQRLRADDALTVFEGQVPNPYPKPPYALVYTQVSWPDADPDNGVDGESGTCVTRWWVHNVGANAAAARAVGSRSRTALLDQRPAIAGRVCGQIRQVDSLPAQRDETTGSLVMDQVTVYELRTRPA